jgi:hypothetical protein
MCSLCCCRLCERARTQKGNEKAGQGRIFRANLEIPKGQTPANRKDIELLFDGLPEPIDLELDLSNRMMYWTDRGDPPSGNTVNRAPMDAPPGKRKDPEIIVTHLKEGVGLALDLKGGRMFIADLDGSVYGANLDGSNKKELLFFEGNLTGIAYTDKEANKKLYGKELGAKEIVTGDQPVVSAAEPLVSLLNETSPDRK